MHKHPPNQSFLTRQFKIRDDFIVFTLYAILIFALVTKFQFLNHVTIHKDEFWRLSEVYDFLNGRLSGIFQKIHIYFFMWLPHIEGHEIDQIIAARHIIFGLHICTGFFIYLISRRFFSHISALFTVLAYFSFSNVLWHGTAFRADPMITFLLMGSLLIVLYKNHSFLYALLAGFCIGLAGAISIKSIFYTPIIAIILLIHWRKSNFQKHPFYYALLTGFTAIVSLAILLFLHKAALPDTAGYIASEDITWKIEKFIIDEDDPFKRYTIFLQTLTTDLFFWLFIFAGLVSGLRHLLKPGTYSRDDLCMILSFALPLCTLLFYRNTIHYFYVFMLAPVCILAGFAIHNYLKTRPDRAKLVLMAASLIFALQIYVYSAARLSYDITLAFQNQMLGTIHKSFPEPVAYSDSNFFVPAYPKIRHRVYKDYLDAYYGGASPSMKEIFTEGKPVFIVSETKTAADQDRIEQNDLLFRFPLLEADQDFIMNNYVPHWHFLSVAGKYFEFERGVSEKTFTIHIDGPYTVESKVPVLINGRTYASGEVVMLDTGEHSVTTTETPATVILRWGDNIHRAKPLEPEDIPKRIWIGD